MLDLWRIYRKSCGPKPPTSALAHLIVSQKPDEGVFQPNPDLLIKAQQDAQRRILRSLRFLAVANHRPDWLSRINRELAKIPADSQHKARTRPHYSTRHWPAAEPKAA